jgi:LysM repeat protein
VEEIKRLNGLVDDTIAPGWKLLIQKGATQPPPMTTVITNTPNPSPTLYSLKTQTPTPPPPASEETTQLIESLRQNKTVVAALIISLSVLIAGVVGSGKQKVS